MTVFTVIFVSLIAVLALPIVREALEVFRLELELKAQIKESEKYEKEQQKLAEKREVERKKREARRQAKVDFMLSIGLEPVLGVDNSWWIRRNEKGKIKELYDLECRRRPIANIVMSPFATTTGWNDATIIYKSEKIRPIDMIEDEKEIGQ
jgi:hypothetical protein